MSTAQRVVAAVSVAPMAVIIHRVLRDLITECEGLPYAVQWLEALATAYQRVIGINLPTGDGGSRTYFVLPANWPPDRAWAYVEAHLDDLRAAFGEISAVHIKPVVGVN